MNRAIIDVPPIFNRFLNVDWRPDWRGQPPAEGTDGSEQVVYNRMPRFVGSPTLVFPPEMIGAWRALIMRGEGRVNAYRIRMTDPAVFDLLQADRWNRDWRAWQAGLWQETRLQITCPNGAAAGAASIVVDERPAPRPIPIGCFLSHSDWPFAVTGRSGSGATTTLQVKLLRKPIPAGASIDLLARGLFLGTSDAMGLPSYDLDRVARPQLDLMEWITR